jgi:Fur family transcriptional regulator, ferric uptake regulator
MTDIKYTNQRVEILDFLKDNYNHPAAEQIYKAVKRKLTRISRATVYNNLKFLSQKGLINEINIGGISRYEPKQDKHHHLICIKCGKIIDLKSDKLYSYAMKIAGNIKNFDVESFTTNFFGICKKCKGGK